MNRFVLDRNLRAARRRVRQHHKSDPAAADGGSAADRLPGAADAFSSDRHGHRPSPSTYAPTVVNGKAPVTTTCTPPSGSSFGVGHDGRELHGDRRAAAGQRLLVHDHRLAAPVVPKLTVTRFVAFGDSITAGEDGVDGGPNTSYLCVPVTSTASIRQRVILPDAQTYPGQLQAQLSARYTTQSPTVAEARLSGGEYADRGQHSAAFRCNRVNRPVRRRLDHGRIERSLRADPHRCGRLGGRCAQHSWSPTQRLPVCARCWRRFRR